MLVIRIGAEPTASGTVRAAAFELIDPRTGALAASWAADDKGGVLIRLHPRHDHAAMEIGLMTDGRPFVRMYGRDGKNRVSIDLDVNDKPMIVISDERWEARVLLGYNEPDFVSPD